MLVMKIMWKTLRVLQLCVSRILLSADTASRILNERSTGDPVINHCCQPNKTRSNLAFSLRIHPLAAETLVSFCLFTQNLQSSAIFCCIFFLRHRFNLVFQLGNHLVRNFPWLLLTTGRQMVAWVSRDRYHLRNHKIEENIISMHEQCQIVSKWSMPK